MGVTSQILIQKPMDGTHRPGQAISGTIKYTIDEPTEYHDILLSFVGKGKCSWCEIIYSSINTSHSYEGTEEYITVVQQILDKKGANSVIVSQGTYEEKFHFILPKNIPPSYKDKNCAITYTLKLKFIKPSSFKSVTKFYATVPVQGTTESSEPRGVVIFGLSKPLIKPLSSKKHEIDVKAKINETTIQPGGETELSFIVTNDTDVNIPKLKMEVISYTKYTANCGSTKSKSATIKDLVTETPSVPARAVVNLSSIIKTLPDMYSIYNSKIISREYKIKLILKLPVPYVNSSVLLPIMMTAREDEDSAEVDDEPPLYWEAMTEK